VIRDRLPHEYLPELIDANGEASVRATLETHFVSPLAFDILRRDPFEATDFEDFISERQRTLQEAIEDLLVKERLDLTPTLRELDAQVERVELALRELVADVLSDDSSRLPGHVQQRVGERLTAAARRNAAFDSDRYGTLRGKLEYFDLREIEDSIASKSLWPEFESCFGSKEVLATRFGQLAELRNSIRHSRAVDEVTQKDGQAALSWFGKILERHAPSSGSVETSHQ
jgi:hypothetical protein